MPRIRIKTFRGQPAVPNVSLGQQTVRGPTTVKSVDARGNEFEQYIPGASFCAWLVPPGMVKNENEVDIAEVDDDFARIMCDERDICERVAGRPPKDDGVRRGA